jgi:hypothetical protein
MKIEFVFQGKRKKEQRNYLRKFNNKWILTNNFLEGTNYNYSCYPLNKPVNFGNF